MQIPKTMSLRSTKVLFLMGNSGRTQTNQMFDPCGVQERATYIQKPHAIHIHFSFAQNPEFIVTGT